MTALTGSSSRNSSAVWRAVSSAHRVVVSTPRIRQRAPRPAQIHQPAWVAAAKPGPIAPEIAPPQTAPITATPSVNPTVRLVEATAAATPACEAGMPDTAVLVIGGLTRPQPIPNRK